MVAAGLDWLSWAFGTSAVVAAATEGEIRANRAVMRGSRPRGVGRVGMRASARGWLGN